MILLLLIGIGIVSALWTSYYRWSWSKDVTVELEFGAEYVYAGQETKLYEVIENRKRMPVPVLEVGFHTRKELDFADTENTSVSDYIYKRDIFSVLGRQRITRQIPVKCTKRGHYTVSDADITTYSLLYHKRYSKGSSTSAGLYVFPGMTDVSKIMAAYERLTGTRQCAKRLHEDPFAFRTIRGYTAEDPMRAINWKASARTGALMVNTFDSVQAQKAMVLLDAEDTGILKYEALVEESIAVAATILRKLLRRQTWAGLAFNGRDSQGQTPPVWIPNGIPSGMGCSLSGIERMFAEYDKENGAQDFGLFLDTVAADISSERAFLDDVLFIVITKNLDARLMAHIEGCVDGRQALVVVPVYTGEERSVAAPKNIRVVMREVDRS